MSRQVIQPRERHIDFVNDYSIPWYIIHHQYARTMPRDGELRFQSEKGNIFVFHFHLSRMESYLYNRCSRFCFSQGKDVSNEELLAMAQNLTTDITSKLHKHNPAIGREILFWVYSDRCIIRKPVEVKDVLNFVLSVGTFNDLKDIILDNGLHSMNPEVSLPVVCTFHSALLEHRRPDKFRLGLHFYFRNYYHVDEVNSQTVTQTSSLLKYSNVGSYYDEEQENTSDFLKSDFVGSRGRVFTVRGPRSVKTFDAFLRYITDITRNSHEPFEVRPCVPIIKKKVLRKDDSDDDLDVVKREVIQGQSDLSLDIPGYFRLQILSNDHLAIRQAVSSATAESDKVAYSFTVDDPDIFFDMSCRQPFFTIYTSSVKGLVRFMRAYVNIGTAWRFGLELRRPKPKIAERMLAAIKIVGFNSRFQFFYIVQSDKESMLEVAEKLADKSENLYQPVGESITLLEVPDFKFLPHLRRSKSAVVQK